MKRLHLLLFILLWSITNLHAQSKGLDQPHLTAHSPELTQPVKPTSSFAFTFDSAIETNGISKHTVILKRLSPSKKKIQGNLSIRDKTTLLFSPLKPLEQGTYRLKVKPVKLLTQTDTSFTPKTWWQKFVVWLCSLFYDDITECPLCQKVCALPHTVTIRPIVTTFTVETDAPKVVSLETNATLIELSEHNRTAIAVTATYDDNTTEDVTQKATYSSSDASVDVDKGIITTNAEGSADVTVSYGGKSTTIRVEVYEMIEGHLLPHEPQDPDATLLGVDANNNGVRDDVERWIYKEMPTYHHPEIERVIAMQDARAYQMTLIDPSNKDDIVHKAMERGGDCWAYYSWSKNLPFDGIIQKFSNRLKDKQFNTKERLKTYMQYNYSLKGRVLKLTPLRLLDTSYCDKNIDILP